MTRIGRYLYFSAVLGLVSISGCGAGVDSNGLVPGRTPTQVSGSDAAADLYVSPEANTDDVHVQPADAAPLPPPDGPTSPTWPRCPISVRWAAQACQSPGDGGDFDRHRTTDGMICDVCDGEGPRPCWTTAAELAIPTTTCAPAARVLCIASCAGATSCRPSGGKACGM
jgi:hypothetical protein